MSTGTCWRLPVADPLRFLLAVEAAQRRAFGALAEADECIQFEYELPPVERRVLIHRAACMM